MSELSSLQANFDSANSEMDRAKGRSLEQDAEIQKQLAETRRLEESLAQMAKTHALALKEAEESKIRLEAMEREARAAEEEKEEFF